MKTTGKKPARRPKKAVASLTPEERAKLLEPGDNLDSLVELAAAKLRAARQMGKRLPIKVSAVKLESLYRRYEKSRQREQALQERFASKLRRLSDRRLVDGHRALMAVLDVNDAANFAGRRDGEIAELRDALTTRSAPGRMPPEGSGGAPISAGTGGVRLYVSSRVIHFTAGGGTSWRRSRSTRRSGRSSATTALSSCSGMKPSASPFSICWSSGS